MALRGKKTSNKHHKQTNRPISYLKTPPGLFSLKDRHKNEALSSVLKRWSHFEKGKAIFHRINPLPQKCSACTQSTEPKCSCHTAGPAGTALLQGYEFQKRTSGWPVLLAWVAKAPEKPQQFPNQSHKGAENPKRHLHFQLPPSSHSAVHAEGALGQNSVWPEILAVSEQRHLCLYFKAEHFYFIHSRRQIVNIPEVFYLLNTAREAQQLQMFIALLSFGLNTKYGHAPQTSNNKT